MTPIYITKSKKKCGMIFQTGKIQNKKATAQRLSDMVPSSDSMWKGSLNNPVLF